MSIDDETRAAQERLEANRARLGIEPPTVASAGYAGEWHRAKAARSEETLADVLGRAMAAPALHAPPPSPDDMAYDRAVARVEAGTPDRFARVTWHNLLGLTSDGVPSFRGIVEIDGEPTRIRLAAVDVLRRVLERPRVVLLGETGSGKSLTLAAHVDGLCRQGERVRWAQADSLDGGNIEAALGARTMALDGLGEELGNAEVPWLVAQRSERTVKLINHLARLQGKRLVVTTALDWPTMGKLYGGNIARRVYEGAAVVRLGAA